MQKDAFLDKLRNRAARVTVFGLGRVGLPEAVLIAEAGYNVTGFDTNSWTVDLISKGHSNMNEPMLDGVIGRVTKKGLFKVTSDAKTATKDSDIIIICVPTPIREDKAPNLSYVEEACRAFARDMRRGSLIVIESTLPPKSTKFFISPLLESTSGLKCGRDFWLSHCPERITPGKALEEFTLNDRIVGGYDGESAEIAAEFFRTFVKGKVTSTDATTAEIAKLAENTFRDINIAFANQLALMCEQVGVDVMKVIELANTHPRVNIHAPGPGVGGPCLTKDPYLLARAGEGIFGSGFINLARAINGYMPVHTIELIQKAINESGVRSPKIAVLGASYKGGVDDTRESPAEDIVKQIISLGYRVVVYDPYTSEAFGAERANSLEEAVTGSDIAVTVTDHPEFKNLDLKKLKDLMRTGLIVDARRIIDPAIALKNNIKYFGIGFGAAH